MIENASFFKKKHTISKIHISQQRGLFLSYLQSFMKISNSKRSIVFFFFLLFLFYFSFPFVRNVISVSCFQIQTKRASLTPHIFVLMFNLKNNNISFHLVVISFYIWFQIMYFIYTLFLKLCLLLLSWKKV